MIHFLKNCFQNVLMTSQPRAPQTHQCFSNFGWFTWRFPGLSFPQWLLHPSHSLWLSCPAAALGAMVTSKSGVLGMYLKLCVCTQRHELGCSWRGCDQEWGRQGAGVAELGSTETTTFCCSWQGGWNTGLLYNSVIRCENPQTIKSYSVMYFNEPVEIYEI